MMHYESDLPEHYHAAFTIDAADKKTGIILNVIGAVIMIVLILPAVFILRPWTGEIGKLSIGLLIVTVTLFVYLVLHELTHGAAYKLLTGQKLTFGLTATVAYCGVPNIYVYRTASLIALLAPFVVFDIVFGSAVIALQDPMNKFLAWLVFSIHVGGCVGDLYDTGLYLTRFRDKRTLMRDTGPKQTFYLPD